MADMIFTTLCPRMTCMEAALLQLYLPNGPVRLWTDLRPFKSPMVQISSLTYALNLI